jgi:hypothetical protein
MLRSITREAFLVKMIRYQAQYGHRVFHVNQDMPKVVRVDRTTRFGNPYPMIKSSHATATSERLRVCHMYYESTIRRIRLDPEFAAQVAALDDRIVACHCNRGSNALNHDTFCHGMILLAAARMIAERGAQTKET